MSDVMLLKRLSSCNKVSWSMMKNMFPLLFCKIWLSFASKYHLMGVKHFFLYGRLYFCFHKVNFPFLSWIYIIWGWWKPILFRYRLQYEKKKEKKLTFADFNRLWITLVCVAWIIWLLQQSPALQHFNPGNYISIYFCRLRVVLEKGKICFYAKQSSS